jgi:Protein of unknown function (DUF3105)
MRRFFCCLAAVLVVATGCSNARGSEDGAVASAVAAPEGIPGVVLERAASRAHQQGHIDYAGKKPPSGGAHNPVPAPCGFYDQAIPDENAVHSLEHGAVWIAYRPDTASADRQTIENIVRTHAYVLASPYPSLDGPLVLVAWERRLEVLSVSDARVLQFVQTYAGGATAPERGAAC